MTITLEILKIKGPDGTEQYKAIISLKDAIADSSQSKKLIKIQDAYTKYVYESRELWLQMKKNKKRMADSCLQWRLANFLFSFCEFTDKEGYLLSNLSQAIVRDIGISPSQTNYLRKFRARYPSIEKVSAEINWSKYRELMDISSDTIRKECEGKILNGEIKTDSEIREFKKIHRAKK